ncbi:hypothetical protein AA21952_3279 [Acetobacter oeni LMG 21952]|nr:hypothetical protein AA21952_3279 [Acetobacter oeni LMG 21952]
MYLSPALKRVFVRDYDDIWFPPGAAEPLRAQDENIVVTERTVIDSLEIGGLSLSQVPASLLNGEAHHNAGGLPVIGLIGRDILRHAELLLDVPHGKLALFRWNPKKECGETPAAIFSGEVYDVPMDDGVSIQVRTGAVSRRLRLDPDLAISVMPRSDAHDAGVSDEMLARDQHETIRYESILRGQRHRFGAVGIGTDTLTAFDFLVQDTIRGGALGENFFEGVVALFDFPHGRFIFQPTDDRNTAPVLHLHFDQSRLGYASVHEARGKSGGR